MAGRQATEQATHLMEPLPSHRCPDAPGARKLMMSNTFEAQSNIICHGGSIHLAFNPRARPHKTMTGGINHYPSRMPLVETLHQMTPGHF